MYILIISSKQKSIHEEYDFSNSRELKMIYKTVSKRDGNLILRLFCSMFSHFETELNKK